MNTNQTITTAQSWIIDETNQFHQLIANMSSNYTDL